MLGNETFLNPLISAGFRVKWISRIPGVPVDVEREEAVSRLMPYHLDAVTALGGSEERFWLSEQVHGNQVSHVSGISDGVPVKGADGLITQDPEAVLGIYVADCGAIYLADPVKKVVAVLHSGRVGTEKNILGRGIDALRIQYGSNPANLIVVLAPCIRPPAYEVDFSAIIKEQAVSAGVLPEQYYDQGVCTTSNLNEFYSYRAEKGKTGRMLALIGV